MFLLGLGVGLIVGVNLALIILALINSKKN